MTDPRAAGRRKGNAAPAWLADYLRAWWPQAEKTPNGRPGGDILGTPGVEWEVKTGPQMKPAEWMGQAAKYAATGVPSILVYYGPKQARQHTPRVMASVPLNVMMRLLQEAGYTPQPGGDAGKYCDCGAYVVDEPAHSAWHRRLFAGQPDNRTTGQPDNRTEEEK